MFEVRPQLSKNNIESRLNELDLFKFYCPGFKNPNHKFRSEFRDDKNPSAVVNCSLDGVYRYIDYGDPMQLESYDIYDYISRKFNLNFFEVLQKINMDFKLGLGYLTKDPVTSNIRRTKIPRIKPKKGIYPLPVRKIKWTNDHYRFWAQYGLTRSEAKYYCDLFNIYPISDFWLNTDTLTNKHYSVTRVGFCYDLHYVDGIVLRKIYLPSVKGSIFFTNSNLPTQGFRQLPKTGDLVFITSSLKDVVVLRSNGFYSVGPSNENVFIRDVVYKNLKSRFKKLVILYDNDYTKSQNWGKMFAEKHSKEYGIPYILLPDGLGKDPSDYVKTTGRSNLISFLNNEVLNML